MRKAISGQIASFKKKLFETQAEIICPFTNEILTDRNVHIDHYSPLFIDLVESFISQHHIDYERFPLTDGSGQNEEGNSISCPETLLMWEEFHKKNANLRAVSVKANLSILRKKH